MSGQSKQRRGFVLGLVMTGVLAACGSSHSSAVSTAALSSGGGTPAALIAKFKSAGLPVASTIAYTAANDPNHLLGRPNGYVAKVAWADSRIKASDPDVKDNTPGSVDLGGSIEQYPDKSGAKAREKYIQGIEKAVQFVGTEYDYVDGDFLIRVSSQLTPDQAKAYQKAAG
jgi:hypothetical protein